MAALCKGTGTSVFVENIFESRYRHVDELSRMGADIRVRARWPWSAACPGSTARRSNPPIRGAARLVVAALGAEGRSGSRACTTSTGGYHDLELALRRSGR